MLVSERFCKTLRIKVEDEIYVLYFRPVYKQIKGWNIEMYNVFSKFLDQARWVRSLSGIDFSTFWQFSDWWHNFANFQYKDFVNAVIGTPLMTVHVVKGEFQINVRIFPTLVCLLNDLCYMHNVLIFLDSYLRIRKSY